MPPLCEITPEPSTPFPGLEIEGVQLLVVKKLNSVPLGPKTTTIPQLQWPRSASPGDTVCDTQSLHSFHPWRRTPSALHKKQQQPSIVEKHLRILFGSGANLIVRGLDMLCRATRSTTLLLARASLCSCLQATLGQSVCATRGLATATRNNNMSRHSTAPTTAGAGAGGAGAGNGTGLGAEFDVSCGVAVRDASCPPVEAPELLNLGCGFPGTDINRAHTVPVLQRAMAALTADADRLERFMQVRYCRFLLLLLPCL